MKFRSPAPTVSQFIIFFMKKIMDLVYIYIIFGYFDFCEEIEQKIMCD